MKSTHILIVVIILLVLGVGAYVAFRPSQTEEAPQPTSQGKIDINAVCEGALAYMSFTDGASADAFVAECKEGKHPEVIEDFKAQLNVGAGAEI